jgi:hypothetical protein
MFQLVLAFAFLAGASDAGAQPAKDPTVARVQDEILALSREVNEAVEKGDRAALERIFAPEFVFVHAYGYVDDRATQIDDLLRSRVGATQRVPTFAPPNELLIYGDVAVHRRPKGTTSDESPAWGTVIYAKREGRYQIIQAQGTEMQPERQWLTLPTDTLDAYAGRYKGTNVIALKRESDTLVAEAPVMGRLILRPTSETLFFDKAGGEWTFHRGPDGKVAYYVRRFRGQERRATRIE